MGQDYDLSKQQLTELVMPPNALRPRPAPRPPDKPLVQPPTPPPQNQPPPPPPPPQPPPTASSTGDRPGRCTERRRATRCTAESITRRHDGAGSGGIAAAGTAEAGAAKAASTERGATSRRKWRKTQIRTRSELRILWTAPERSFSSRSTRAVDDIRTGPSDRTAERAGGSQFLDGRTDDSFRYEGIRLRPLHEPGRQSRSLQLV